MIMKKSILTKGLLLAASLPLLAGCVVFERQPVAVAPPSAEVVVAQPENPPAPQVEVMPAPPGPLTLWLWVPGGWEWRGQWVWARGHWAPRPHPHAIWVAGHWDRHDHGYVWVDSHWR
jgi:hypothetical protein